MDDEIVTGDGSVRHSLYERGTFRNSFEVV